jgi:flagellar hook assembly protein FlgD
MQYVTQLAQFSQLEQTIGMRSDLAALREVYAPEASDTTEKTE